MLSPYIIHYRRRLALLGFGICYLALVEGAVTFVTEVVTTPCSTDPAVASIALPSGMHESARSSHGSIGIHSTNTDAHHTGGAAVSTDGVALPTGVFDDPTDGVAHPTGAAADSTDAVAHPTGAFVDSSDAAAHPTGAVVHSTSAGKHSAGKAVSSAGTFISSASAKLVPSSAINGSLAPSVMASMDLASLCMAYSGRTPFVPSATGFATANATSANDTLLSGNSTLLSSANAASANDTLLSGNSTMFSSDVPAPDWTLSTADLALPPTIPNPKSHSVGDPATAQLIRTVQDKVLQSYEMYSTFNCFKYGSSFDCKGPWLFASDWDNSSLSYRVVSNTISDSSWSCSYDTTYAGAPSDDRTFYGFTAANLTNSLQAMVNYTALWAAGACTANSSCATAYHNDTEQMSSDFRGYIESGFFEYIKTALQKSSLSYCPRQIGDIPSMITFATSYFDGGREYFGMHNAFFVDGVAQNIDGNREEARLELGLSLANNAKRAEAVFLNMILFAPHSTDPLAKRAADDDEVYPGCPRREYVLKGSCEGVLPPREYDLAGDFMPMKDRDELEVLGLTSHKLGNTGLVPRDTDCDTRQSRLAKTLKDVQIARETFSILMGVLAAAYPIVVAIEVGGPAALVLFALAMPELVALATIAECQTFKTCDGIPPAVYDTTNLISKIQAGLAAKFLTERAGFKTLASLLRRVITEGNLGVLSKGKNLAAGGAAVLVGLGGTVVDKLLSNAQKYYEGALGCCKSTDCASAACRQASIFCLMSFGNTWSGSGSVRCDFT